MQLGLGRLLHGTPIEHDAYCNVKLGVRTVFLGGVVGGGERFQLQVCVRSSELQNRESCTGVPRKTAQAPEKRRACIQCGSLFGLRDLNCHIRDIHSIPRLRKTLANEIHQRYLRFGCNALFANGKYFIRIAIQKIRSLW